MDNYQRIRDQRHQHLENARWWKIRYRSWGSEMARQWFLAESRLHRLCSRCLWQAGTN